MAQMKKYAGCFYLAPVDEFGNTTEGYEFIGEAAPLELSTPEEVKKAIGVTCETAGNTVATFSQPGDASGKVRVREYTIGNIARGLRALVTKNEKVEETFTDKEITFGQLGQWEDVGYEDLSDIEVITSPGGVTLVEGDDYTINSSLGLITPLKASLVAKKVNISGTSAAGTGVILTIGAGASGKYALKGKMLDLNSKKEEKVFLRMVLLTASSGIVLNSEDGTDYETIEFELTPEIPAGQKDYGTWGIPA